MERDGNKYFQRRGVKQKSHPDSKNSWLSCQPFKSSNSRLIKAVKIHFHTPLKHNNNTIHMNFTIRSCCNRSTQCGWEEYHHQVNNSLNSWKSKWLRGIVKVRSRKWTYTCHLWNNFHSNQICPNLISATTKNNSSRESNRANCKWEGRLRVKMWIRGKMWLKVKCRLGYHTNDKIVTLLNNSNINKDLNSRS